MRERLVKVNLRYEINYNCRKHNIFGYMFTNDYYDFYCNYSNVNVYNNNIIYYYYNETYYDYNYRKHSNYNNKRRHNNKRRQRRLRKTM